MTFIWQKKKKVISYERVASNLEGGKDKAECSGRETGRGGGGGRKDAAVRLRERLMRLFFFI